MVCAWAGVVRSLGSPWSVERQPESDSTDNESTQLPAPRTNASRETGSWSLSQGIAPHDAELIKGLLAGLLGHRQVEDDEVDGVRLLLGELEPAGGAFRQGLLLPAAG